MASTHTDKLVKRFLDGHTKSGFDRDKDLQDPTFMSFRLDFFPDMGFSFPDDYYSSGGLFRPQNSSSFGDGFYDSATDYLARIGAPTRQYQLEAFIHTLYELQTNSPWYFQTITGLNDLYTIDPANNFRGKDKVITIDCLETIDMKMSMLADLYRNVAFDFQNMREVLPVNLRTFNMNIHVLEFRKFNTTFGVLADYFGSENRSVYGQNRQQEEMDAARRNKQNGTTLYDAPVEGQDFVQPRQSTYDIRTGSKIEDNPDVITKSAFEAISVQTFSLKDCQFDFFSEAPDYLSSVSVKDSQEATFRFKIKVDKIQKTGTYSFDKYIISEYTKNSAVNAQLLSTASGLKRTIPVESRPYFEQLERTVQMDTNTYMEFRESIFPSDMSLGEAYMKKSALREELNKEKALEKADNLQNYPVNPITGHPYLGNIYNDSRLFGFINNALNNFLSPNNQLNIKTPSEVLGRIQYDVQDIVRTLNPLNIFKK